MFKIINNKKGSEKPIEIFIALFVILAVAMVLLKMFGGQIISKQKELKDMADQSKIDQLKKSVKSYCSNKCNEIESQLDKVTYCKTRFVGDVDFNNNGIINEYNSEFSIFGVCEDTIYCPVVYECQSFNMKNCVEILCDYFKDEWGLNQTEATSRLDSFIKPGTCQMTDDQKLNHWYYMIEKEMTCS